MNPFLKRVGIVVLILGFFISCGFGFVPKAFASGNYSWATRTASGLRNWQSITSSSDGTKLAAAVQDGDIYTSTNGGTTWTDRTAAGSRSWRTITSSSDGTKLVAGAFNSYMYISTNSGVTWTALTAAGSRNWDSIIISPDGTKLAAAVYIGDIYTSTNGGTTWTDRTAAGSRAWQSITSSSDGTKLAAVVNFNGAGDIYTSINSGATWIDRTAAGSRAWTSITSSSDGIKLAAVEYGTGGGSGDIYNSTNSGATWTNSSSQPSSNWTSITSSSDGTKLAVASQYVYTSIDGGATLEPEIYGPFQSITSSSDGTKLAAVVSGGGYIYTSLIGPTAFTATTSPSCGGKTNLSWNAAAGVTSYTLSRFQGTQYVSIATLSSTTLAYTDTAGQYLTSESYQLVDTNSYGTSTALFASANTSDTCTPPPPAPTGLTAASSATCGGKIDLAWNTAAGATSYAVYRATSGTYSFVGSAATNAYTDSPGDQSSYHYVVYSLNSYGTSTSASNIATASGSGICLPQAPSKLKASTGATCGGTINLSWNAGSGATSYGVYRSSGGVYSLIGTSTALSYFDIPGNQNSFSYKVYSVNSYGTSTSASSISSASGSAACGAPFSCTRDSVTVTSGQSYIFYSKHQVAASSTCDGASLLCTNGNLFTPAGATDTIPIYPYASCIKSPEFKEF
jgi:hypothetical protein